MKDEREMQPAAPDELAFGIGGKTLAIRGGYTVVIIVILSLVLFQGWMLWDFVGDGRQKIIAAAITDHNAITAREHGALKEAIDAQTAVLREQRQLQEEQNYMLFFATPEEKTRIQGLIRQPPRFNELLNGFEPRRRGRSNER